MVNYGGPSSAVKISTKPGPVDRNQIRAIIIEDG